MHPILSLQGSDAFSREGLDQVDTAIAMELVQHRQQLLGFVRRKVDDPDLAEDIFQDSLLKALRAAPDLRERDKLLPWFYTILNNTIAGTYRRRQTEAKSVQQLGYEQEFVTTIADEQILCACFRELIPTLKPEYAEVIEKLDLAGGDSAQVAAQLGITANNLKVRHHRARQALRQRLEESCRLCAKHGCLDCTCAADDISPTATS